MPKLDFSANLRMTALKAISGLAPSPIIQECIGRFWVENIHGMYVSFRLLLTVRHQNVLDRQILEGSSDRRSAMEIMAERVAVITLTG